MKQFCHKRAALSVLLMLPCAAQALGDYETGAMGQEREGLMSVIDGDAGTVSDDDIVYFNGTAFRVHQHFDELGKAASEYVSGKVFGTDGKDLSTSYADFRTLWKPRAGDEAKKPSGVITLSVAAEYAVPKRFTCYHIVASVKGSANLTGLPQTKSAQTQKEQYFRLVRGVDHRFIVDMQTEQVIGMEQIFEPAVAQKLGKMFGQDVSIYAEDRCLQLKSKAGDGRFIFSKTTENNFTDYFKKLLDWEHLGVNGDTPRFLHGQTGLESYFSEAGCELGGDDESAVSVTISLIVKEDGTPVQAKIENDIDDIDEDKLLALCSKMPKWMPAYQDGQPVMKDVVFSLSVKKQAYDVVPQMPSFTGGQGALFSYLSQSIKYPEDCEKHGVQGRVICTFVVERDGSISDVRVVKGVHPLLDAEAVRVIRNMPNWQPGMQKGKAVRVKFTIPVTFRLQ